VFPVAEKASLEFVSLPMFAELTGEQISRVATELKAIVPAPVS
jgi:dTDP-4-amino-4,6-dideoxygalactose transaminase